MNNVKVFSEAGEEVPVASVNIDQENEKATFKLGASLQPGQYSLKLDFKGVIIDKLKGFYYSKYTT